MEIPIRRREHEVWQACDDLWARFGSMKDLTGDIIREQLVLHGKSRGSPNEIYKYRKSWMQSRKIAVDEVNHDDDPITRVVRVVHEQLKNDADEAIEKVTADFNKTLAERDASIKEAHDAINKVMAEFSDLEREKSQVVARAQALDAQLQAEIDVRRALERELQLKKIEATHLVQAHEKLVSELKAVYLKESSDAKLREQEARLSSTNAIRVLEDEKRALGYEYSEKLNEVKTELYNQKIQTQKSDEKFLEAQQEVRQLRDKLAALVEKNNELISEINHVEKSAGETKERLMLLQMDHVRLTEKYVRSEHAQRKATTTIARLRAVMSREA